MQDVHAMLCQAGLSEKKFERKLEKGVCMTQLPCVFWVSHRTEWLPLTTQAGLDFCLWAFSFHFIKINFPH